MMWLSHRKTTFNFFIFFLFFKYVNYIYKYEYKIKIRSVLFYKKRSLFLFSFFFKESVTIILKIKLICGASPPFFFYDSYKLLHALVVNPVNISEKFSLSLFKIQNPDGPLSYALTPPPFTKSLSAN